MHFTLFRVKWTQSGHNRELLGVNAKQQRVANRPHTPRFVSTRVSTLPPGTYTDPGQTGLQLRVRALADGKVSRTWLLRFKFNGEETRIALGRFPGMTIDHARGEARKARDLASQGIDPRRARPQRRSTSTRGPSAPGAAPGAPSAPHSVETLAAEFLDQHVRPHRKAPQYAERIIAKEILPEWRRRDARTITPREVVELLDGIVARGSRVMANRTAAILSQMFRYGIHRAIVDSSPVQLLYRPGGREKPRERALDDAEIGALLCNIDDVMRSPRMAHAIRLLLATGQRRGELALARWRDIDLAARIWHIPPEHSKTGAAHMVPLSDFAVLEFERLKVATPARRRFVFAAEGGDAPIDPKLITRVIARNRTSFEKLKIAPFTAHDLRRSCRTGLAKLGIVPHVAERVLNHKQPGIVGVYDRHGYENEMREALDRWGAHLEKLRT